MIKLESSLMPILISLSLAVAVVLAVTGVIDSANNRADAFCFRSLPTPLAVTPKFPRSITVTTTTTTTTTLFVSQSNEGKDKGTTQEGGGEESEEDFQRRMAVVRSLQMSFYGKDASKETVAASGSDAAQFDTSDGNSSSNASPPELEASTGTISRLPLFRAAWYELPGRSNVLIIRDPIYTNMFERIFYTTQSSNATAGNQLTPWVFGHLYTPKEPESNSDATKAQASLSSSKPTSSHELMAWNNSTDHRTATSSLSSPAVLGTLLYIRDFRRLKDGRILALVQAAEKFVVETIRQTLPYAVADVRILPDSEELGIIAPDVEDNDSENDHDSSPAVPASVYSCDETDRDERLLVGCLRADEETLAAPARARAVFDSINSYNNYECDPGQRLDGIPDKSNLGVVDITHDAISRALPYCRYSNSTSVLEGAGNNGANISNDDDDDVVDSPPTDSLSPSLEFELLRRGITRIPPSDRRFSYITEPAYSSSSPDDEENQSVESSSSWTTEELEYELWLVIDYFSAATKKPVSPILLALLPREEAMPKPWPSDFSLKTMREEEVQNNSVSTGYPDHKRQRRLSYSAAHLLEGVLPLREGIGGEASPPVGDSKTGIFEVDEVQEFRALLLSVPSTRQRLRVVLETFHRWRLYQEWDEFA